MAAEKQGMLRPAALVLIAVLALVMPASAEAATCSSGGRTMTVTLNVSNETATVSTLAGVFALNGTPCAGGATTANTDAVAVTTTATGNETLVLDLANGAFGPGATSEVAGSSEIEFAVNLGSSTADRLTLQGSPGPDQLTLGGDGVNLNGDDDADVLPTGVEAFTASGADGNDQLSAAGGLGTDAPLAAPANLLGEEGDDTISAGRGNDTLAGGPGINSLDFAAAESGVIVSLATSANQNTGGAGTDAITGFRHLAGTAFDDDLTGDGNNNALTGLDGEDVLEGAGGDDLLDGGGGASDSADYSASQTAVQVDLGAGRASGRAGNDLLGGIENATAGAGNDVLRGSEAGNVLIGGAGLDIVEGRGGEDALDGGVGSDQLDYSSASAPVAVNLATQRASGAGEDRVSAFEDIVGGAGGDRLSGDGLANRIDGGGGHDLLRGKGGDDTLVGALGRDTVDYSGFVPITEDGGVVVDLSRGRAAGEGADDLDSVESVIGSGAADDLRGSRAANALRGGPGNDRIFGSSGNDLLSGSSGNDRLEPGRGRDRVRGDSGRDLISGRDRARDRIDGGSGPDRARVDRQGRRRDRVRAVERLF